MNAMAHAPEWYAERQSYIGASDAPVLTGDDPWTSEYELWLEKTGQQTGDRGDSQVLRWGRRVEDAVAAEYEDETGRKLRRSPLRRLRGTSFIACHPDRLVEGERRLVEIKSSWRPWDEVPERVVVQVQHQMGVLGYDVADVAVATGFAGFRIYEIPRNDVLIANLFKVERAWWERHVVKGVEPERRGRFLDELRGQDVMNASPEQAEAARTLRAIRDRLKQLEATEENLVDWLKQSMAGAYRLNGRDYGFSVSWKPGKDGTKTDWKLVAAAYRKALDQLRDGLADARPWSPELEAVVMDPASIESLYTEPKAGTRPFRVTWKDVEPTDGSEEEN